MRVTDQYPGHFIIFEGLDGAGKSTVAARLAEALHFHGHPVSFLARKDPSTDDPRLSQRLETLGGLIWGYGDTPVERLGDHFALFNVASWLSGIDQLRVKPVLAQGQTVVMDNWYYKFLARMALKEGLSDVCTANCFAHLSQPDYVFLLDVTPEVAAARKSKFTRGETGGFDGFGEPSYENFVRYQSLVREILLRDAQHRPGWIVINVDDLEPEDVVGRCLDELPRQKAGTEERQSA